MHQEIVTLRQTLKTALCNGWLDRLPDFSERYRKSPKISHSAKCCLEAQHRRRESGYSAALSIKVFFEENLRYRWSECSTTVLQYAISYG